MGMKRNFSVLVITRPLVGGLLLSLSGCDYWPPALQTEIDTLRAELNDALDDRQQLDQTFAELKLAHASLQHTVAEKDRENHALSLRLSAQVQPAHRPSQANPAPHPVANAPRTFVTKGPFTSLQLEHPHLRGPQIVQVQRLLRRHRLPLNIDGIYGPDTAAAVRWFQRKHDLPADGVVGPTTYRALRGTEKTARLVRQLRLRRPPLAGQDVLIVQRTLRRAGYRVRVDGHFGPETDVAITRFQRKHGIEPDGMVGSQTWAALMLKR